MRKLIMMGHNLPPSKVVADYYIPDVFDDVGVLLSLSMCSSEPPIC